MEEKLDEIFDLSDIFPEIYSSKPFSNCSRILQKPQTADHASRRANTEQLMMSSNRWNSCYGYGLFFTSQIINFSSSGEDGSCNNQYHDAENGTSHKRACTTTRTPLQVQEHVIAERKRRENIGQLFITLSKIVPGLKKLDKSSPLEDATNYLKALKERVRVLEEEMIKKSSIDDASKDDYASYKESSIHNSGSTSESFGPEIKARISNRQVLIEVFCKKQKSLMSRIPCEVEKMHLSMQSEFRGTVKDIVDHLQTVFFNPRDNMEDDHH
ncbi:hypothetical protein Pfo_026471 [Paulownia fortunei]|nr:hypothetical protein Pfo_026471 [Paulownia fortunei]